jgi:23S rRNA pseudouridine2605 synthase
LNQQQLQIARSALWHQTAATDPSAPLLTFDDAARWLDDIGLCLFLPRHTQLPAPAPSFVEACLGAPSVTPPAPAIALATELASRLVAERRVIPLNLLGAFSEQPDFLITPDVLPWAAAVRGDRQWKSPPHARNTPIVLRTWEALDREGEKSAIELREILGRELTEAAVLRALIELWTTLRATPVYSLGQPTRWALLKDRFPAQLATGSNTAQATALSALLSIYLRSAVAATAEEAEIFLSPLTARSRIREVLHGMTATRQLGTMSVASQTLLFVEGSLPEHAAEPEPPPTPREASGPIPARVPFKKEPRPTRWELPRPDARTDRDRPRGPWQKKPPAANRPQAAPERHGQEGKPFPGPRPAFGARSGSGSRPTPGPRPAFGARSASGSRPPSGSRPAPGPRPPFGRPHRPDAKPWQRRSSPPRRGQEFRKEDHAGRPERSAPANRPPFNRTARGEQRPPRADRHSRPEDRRRTPDRARPLDRPRPIGPPRPQNRPPSNKGAATPGTRYGNSRPSRPASPRPYKKFGAKPRFSATGKSSFARPGPGRPASGRPGAGKPGPGKPRTGGPPRPFRTGKSSSGKPPRRPFRGSRPSGPGKPKNKFRKSAPGEPNPRKNRSQEENPE